MNRLAGRERVLEALMAAIPSAGSAAQDHHQWDSSASV
jgi:hypothetical protein